MSLTRRMGAAAAILGFMVIACGSARAEGTSSGYTPRELFEAALTGCGPAARLIPEFSKMSACAKTEEASVARVESRIARKDHAFLDEFASGVTSGDPGLVSTEISRASRLLAAVSKDTSRLDVAKAIPPPPIFIVIDFVEIETRASSSLFSVHSLSTAGLPRDMAVALIARRLAGVHVVWAG
jgi:hypothetical protein